MSQQRVDEKVLKAIEARYSAGFRSAELLQVFVELAMPLSEATLRKYVQLGLLPRSIRIGRKGKHQGSTGVYPVSVMRQIVRIKELLVKGYTIEQIQSDFLFMRTELNELERILASLFRKLGSVLKKRDRKQQVTMVSAQVESARVLAEELLTRLLAVEKRLMTPTHLRSVSAS